MREPAHHARVRRPGDDDDRECGIPEPAAEHRRDDHCEDDRRERKDKVDDAHRESIHKTAEVAGKSADQAADEGRE